MLTVGGFARVAGVSAKVLRAYDAAGLFRPAWVDPSSSYRYYSPAQLPEIRRVVALRQLGLSLEAIGRLVSGGADLGAALEAQRRTLEAERRALERRLAALDIRVAMAEGDLAGPDVVVRQVPAERVATLDPALHGGDIGASFYELEAHVRDAGARAPRPPGAIVGTDRSDQVIFVPIRRTIAPTDRIGVAVLESSRVATVVHRGPYATLGAARDSLLAWAGAGGYAPAGPLRILYLQFGAESELRLPRGWVVERASDFVTELQLPIDQVGSTDHGRAKQVGVDPAR